MTMEEHALTIARVIIHEYMNDCEQAEAIEQILNDYGIDMGEATTLYYWVCGRLGSEPFQE